MRNFRVIFISFFLLFFFFFCHPKGTKFPGQGSDLRRSLNLSHSCRNARYFHRQGANPLPRCHLSRWAMVGTPKPSKLSKLGNVLQQGSKAQKEIPRYRSLAFSVQHLETLNAPLTSSAVSGKAEFPRAPTRKCPGGFLHWLGLNPKPICVPVWGQ